MKRNMLFLPLALLGGFALAALLTTITGGSAGTEATAHAVTRGPVPCGSNAVIEVYLDSLDARTSDLGQPVGLGAYNVALHYPNDALRPAASGGAVTPDAAETVDGAAGRQWIVPPRNGDGDVFRGEFGFGAFSYVGPANPSGDIADVDVTDDLAARERAGVAVTKDAPLLLGTFELATGQAGTHVTTIELELVDSSSDVVGYAVNRITVPVEVKEGPCAEFAKIDPPPTHPPTMPPFPGWDKIPTPDPYPDDITPTAGEFADLGDACEGGTEYITEFRGSRLCLLPGWSVTMDSDESDVATAEANNPPAGQPARSVYTLIEKRGGDAKPVSRIALTVAGSEPFSATRCESPAVIDGMGSVCIHGGGSESSILAGTWRLIGVTLDSGRWVVIEVFDAPEHAAVIVAQREALEIVNSIKVVGP